MQTPVTTYLDDIYECCLDNRSGERADYIRELAEADPEPFAIALCTPDGTQYSAGDALREFTIQSISKPFAYALALRDRGFEAVNATVDVEPSGDAFNEISLDEHTGRPENPMINIGALTTHALIGGPDASAAQRSALIVEGLSQFAGRELTVDEGACASELEDAWRNLALAALMRAAGKIEDDPDDVVLGYTRQCAVRVTVHDLSVMGMTLARGGVNPLTQERVVSPEIAQQVMAVMTSCGMYDAAGDWLSHVGIPAKSGVSGGILGALPGQVGIGTFSPRLDAFGNSARGVQAFEQMSKDMGMHMMAIPAPTINAIGQHCRTDDGSKLVALQGVLDFPTAEMALRRFAQIPPGSDDVIIDLTLVPSIAQAGAKMLLTGMRSLTAEGHGIVIVDPHQRLTAGEDQVTGLRRLDSRPRGALTAAEAPTG